MRLLEWLAMILAVVAYIALVHKKWYGWLIGLSVTILVSIIVASARLWGLPAMQGFFLCINIWGIIKWRKK